MLRELAGSEGRHEYTGTPVTDVCTEAAWIALVGVSTQSSSNSRHSPKRNKRRVSAKKDFSLREVACSTLNGSPKRNKLAERTDLPEQPQQTHVEAPDYCGSVSEVDFAAG